MPLRGLVSAATALSLAVLSACTPLPSYRYKMTVEVDTPEGVRTGSSVIEVRAHHEPRILTEQGGTMIDVVGEAVAVDLPGGETLFFLLAGGAGKRSLPPGYIAGQLLLTREERAGGYSHGAKLLSERHRTKVLDPSQYPRIARFEDTARPESVSELSVDRLEEELGPGFGIRRIIIESTHDPLTNSIVQRLPWLSSSPRYFASYDKNLVGSVLFYKDKPGEK